MDKNSSLTNSNGGNFELSHGNTRLSTGQKAGVASLAIAAIATIAGIFLKGKD